MMKGMLHFHTYSYGSEIRVRKQKAEQICSAFRESVRYLRSVRLAFLAVRSSHLAWALFSI